MAHVHSFVPVREDLNVLQAPVRDGKVRGDQKETIVDCSLVTEQRRRCRSVNKVGQYISVIT